jgi:hypothetical protein
MKKLFSVGLIGFLLLALSISLYSQSNQYVNKLKVKDKITWMNGSREGNSLTNAQVGLINFLVYDTADVSAVTLDATPDTILTKAGHSMKYVLTSAMPALTSTGAITAASGVNLGTSQALVGTTAMTIGNNAQTVAVNSSDWDISATGAITGAGAITADGLITGTAGTTITGAAINLNATSNFATNIGTGTTNAAVSIGGGSNTVAVNSSSWDITTTGVFSGMLRSVVTNTDESETLDATQANCIVTTDGAATITIPNPSAATVGVIYYVCQTADANLIITCTTANSNAIICDGVATTDAVTISTASHLIGAGVIIMGISATKWWIGGLNPEALLTPEAAD